MIVWQDLILTIASSLFGYSLFPLIARLHKVKKTDQIPWQVIVCSSIGVGLTMAACLSLEYYFSVACNGIQLACWCIVTTQKIVYAKSQEQI